MFLIFSSSLRAIEFFGYLYAYNSIHYLDFVKFEVNTLSNIVEH